MIMNHEKSPWMKVRMATQQRLAAMYKNIETLFIYWDSRAASVENAINKNMYNPVEHAVIHIAYMEMKKKADALKVAMLMLLSMIKPSLTEEEFHACDDVYETAKAFAVT